MTMTFDNIQNITVTQGPLERLFGISDVRVTTAGGGEAAAQKKSGHGVGQNLHLGVFRGVDNPDEIRDLMLARLRKLARHAAWAIRPTIIRRSRRQRRRLAAAHDAAEK